MKKNEKKRDITVVLKQLSDALPEELAQKLKFSSSFWAPELVWHNLSKFINHYVEPASNNEQSVKIYAILCDVSEEEMKQRMQDLGV